MNGASNGKFFFNFNKDFYTIHVFCVCSHKLKIQNISDGIFFLSHWSFPRGGTMGCLGIKN